MPEWAGDGWEPSNSPSPRAHGSTRPAGPPGGYGNPPGGYGAPSAPPSEPDAPADYGRSRPRASTAPAGYGAPALPPTPQQRRDDNWFSARPSERTSYQRQGPDRPSRVERERPSRETGHEGQGYQRSSRPQMYQEPPGAPSRPAGYDGERWADAPPPRQTSLMPVTTEPPRPPAPRRASRVAVPDLVPASPGAGRAADLVPAGATERMPATADDNLWQTTVTPAAEGAPTEVAPADAASAEAAPASGPPPKKRRQRDLYVDMLRSIAIVRVITYHTLNFWWLGLFPSMGLMFGLAGSLMAASIDKSARKAVTTRLVRMLPALWLLGAVVVPLMMMHGWKPAADDPNPIGWYAKLSFWIFPLDIPPSSQWAVQTTEVLWYIRTYIWFVCLSPLLLPVFRRFPRTTVMVPLLLTAAFATGQLGDGPIAGAIRDAATYGACWLVGFAHHDGMVKRVRAIDLYVISGILIAIGLWWGFTHVTDEHVHDFTDMPPAQAFYSLGIVIIALRFRPKLAWLGRRKALMLVIGLLNNRALSIYLWHNTMIAIAPNIDDFLFNKTGTKHSFLETTWFMVIVVFITTFTIICLVGWVEDLAARRKPRIAPWPKKKKDPPPRKPTNRSDGNRPESPQRPSGPGSGGHRGKGARRAPARA